MNLKELDDYINEKFPPDSQFWSRIWDDDCICDNIETINPKCTNKRCKNERQD